MAIHRKGRKHAPQGFFACEGLGLRWLAQAQAQGGPRVVTVEGWSEEWLDIERIDACSPTPEASHAFGAALARLHDASASCFGAPPEGYDGTCYFGPLSDPVAMDTGDWQDCASYLAQGRLLPMVELGMRRGILERGDLDLTHRVIDALPHLLGRAGADRPARVHGDLWSGNVMWTRDHGTVEAVLIDPAAHGGHREEDLAMLALFGMPYLTRILDGYRSVHPLASGYEKRTIVWQLYPIAGHCAFFGGGYVSQYRSMCRSLLEY